MDIRQIETAVDLIYRMFIEHPELCPHMYSWAGSTTATIDGKKQTANRYKCGICGHETTDIEEKDV